MHSCSHLEFSPLQVLHDTPSCSGSPDLAQTIVVACCALGVKFKFTGLASLKIKETDRIEALKKELKKVGYVIYDENDNTLIWDGETCEPSFEPIDTYEDHRMALAFWRDASSSPTT